MFSDLIIYGKLVFVLLTSGVFLKNHDFSFLLYVARAGN